MNHDEITELELRSEPAEVALIGAVAHYPDACAHVLAALPGADFYRPSRGVVWDTYRELSEQRRPIDPVTVATHLDAAGELNPAVRRVITVEMSNPGPVAHVGVYADQVADLARRRELLQAVNRARALAGAPGGSTSEALAAVRAVFDTLDRSAAGGGWSGTLDWTGMIDQFRAAHHPDAVKASIPTPWWELDEVIGGLFGGRVYVIGGRPGSGKSTAALVAAMHAAAESHRPTLVISKEMPAVDVTGRILARGAEVPLNEINFRRVSDRSMARIEDYVKRVGDTPIWVDDRPRTLSGIVALARAHHHHHGLEVLVVDYLQLVPTDRAGRNREQEIAEVSRALKALAMELDVAVLLPAQLNRGSTQRADPRPVVSDLRDSGQIEQDADVVILLHQPTDPDGMPTGKIDLIVGKNRHGATATISLRWQGGFGAIG